jgi:hypothetical protein
VASVKNNLVLVLAIVCATILLVSFAAAYTVLAATGGDATNLSRLVNTIFNAAGVVFSALGGAAGIAAFMKARQAAEQTNGGLDARIEAGAHRALTKQRAKDKAPGGELHRDK